MKTGLRRHAHLPLLLLVLLASCRFAPDSRAPAFPQRPTFSSDTNTAAEGTVELEAGLVVDPDDLFATPVNLRYGAGPATELFVGGSPLNYVSGAGEDEVGIGDLVLGVRQRLREEDRLPSFAVQVAMKLPTADEDQGLGTGELDASFAAIASKAVESLSVTGYYQVDVLGDPAGGTALAHGLALAGGHPVADRVGAFAEVAAIFVPEQDVDQLFTTFGATYAASPSLIFDLAFVVGFEDAPDLQVLVGLTHNLGRLIR